MKFMLLTAAVLGAAVTFTATPSAAQHAVGIGIPNATSPDMIGGPGRNFDFCRGNDRFDRRGGRDGHDGHDGHRGNRDGGVNCVIDSYAYADGEWALYNNRSWEADSYNDWWHDRPDRAFPRWVQEQKARGTCDPSRMWWSGSGWHC
jgi:hypothetical protein